MISIKINNRTFIVPKGISIIEACKFVGISIPRFCYHIRLSVAGNCRMCLVESDKALKPVAACATPIMPNMSINTNTPFVLKARENVLETLLLNHPLDCPICDQAGECDLQDQAKVFGSDYSRFFFNKRVVEDKYFGSIIHTIMTRCIQCTRCVRYTSEFVGQSTLGCLGRGTKMEIGTYAPTKFNSLILGNVIDLCPVGALTAKSYAFKYRPWEWWAVESVDLMDSVGSNIYINFNAFKEVRVLPKKNQLLNDYWITDLVRFSYDSIYYSRIENCFFLMGKNFSTYFKPVSWRNVFKNLTLALSKSKWSAFCFVINKTLNFEILCLLKILEFRGKGFIKIFRFDEEAKPNLVRWGINNRFNFVKSLDQLDFCCLFGTNLSFENALLNLKIRLNFNKSRFNIIGNGFFFKSNFNILFLNISTDFISLLLRGKVKAISNQLIKSKLTLFLVGNSVLKRVPKFLELTNQFLTKFPSVIVYNIYADNNKEGLNLINFSTLTRKNLVKDNFYFLFNLDDTTKLRRLFFNLNYGCLHSISSAMDKKALLIAPVMNFHEEGGIFLNFEQRPQLASSIDLPLKNVKPGTYFLKRFILLYLRLFYAYSVKNLNLNSQQNILKGFSFISEVLNNSEVFTYSPANKINLYENFENAYYQVYNYPIKTLFEDPYRYNKVLKNSRVMLNCSRDLRNSEYNFN